MYRYLVFIIVLLTVLYGLSQVNNQTLLFIDVAQPLNIELPLTSAIAIKNTINNYNILSYIPFGAAWADYNQDGCIDLYVANPVGENKLYQNQCNGTFIDIAAQAGVNYSGKTRGVAFGDIDNDGCLDLFISNHAENNKLYHNKCDGTFEDVTEKAGVAGNDNVIATSISWVDYNHDGLLDIYVTNLAHVKPHGNDGIQATENDMIDIIVTSSKNLLYHNNGDGTFTEVGEKTGIAGPAKQFSFAKTFRTIAMQDTGFSYTSMWFDFNRDGCIDVLVVSDSGLSPLYQNNCNGTFTDVSDNTGIKSFLYGRGVAIADIDRNGYQDMYIANGPTDVLFVNHNGTFTDETQQWGIYEEPQIFHEPTKNTFIPYFYREVGWGVAFFDYNNDGNSDVFVANGPNFLQGSKGHTNRLYSNNGQRLNNIESGTMIKQSLRSIGVATADYDNDGDMDFYVTNMNGPNNLYQNINDNGNHWLKVRLRGTVSNSLGIGAEVELTAGDKRWVQQMTSGGSYLSQSDYVLHFGLGKYDTIDTLTIKWPSGIVQKIINIPIDQEITIEEKSI